MTALSALGIQQPARAQLISRIVGLEQLKRKPSLEIARAMWLDYRSEVEKNAGLTQHAYLSRLVAELASQGVNKSVSACYSLLYTGCALENGFEPKDPAAGQPIGKALDRLGLSAEAVRAHMESGTLQEALQSLRAPTESIRVTTRTQDILEDAAEVARSLLNTDGLSDPEIRAIFPAAWERADPGMRHFLLRLGNGDVNLSHIYLIEAPDGPEGLNIRSAAPPLSIEGFYAQMMPCWATAEYPTSRQPNHLHHVRVGEVEARPNDDTPPVMVPVRPFAHIPLPSQPESGAAHSRLYVIGQDAERNAALNRWQACATRAYSAYVTGRDWKVHAEQANQERLHL